MTEQHLTLPSPVGWIGLTLDEGRITSIDFLGREPSAGAAGPGDDPLAVEAAHQLAAYFADSHTRFSLPINPQGTPFQLRVWEALRAILPGEVRSYGDIAAELGSSARAVGGACRANPIPLLIPCHRVVARSGIGGFAGATDGAEIVRKRWLLAHEGVEC